MSFPISFFWRASSKARTRVALSPCVSRGFAITAVLAWLCEKSHSNCHFPNAISPTIHQIGSSALMRLRSQGRLTRGKAVYNENADADKLQFATSAHID